MADQALEVAKEEALVAADWPSQSPAKLILLESTSRNMVAVIEECIRVEICITEKVPNIAVKLVRSGLDRSIDDGPGRHAKLGGIGSGLDAKFRQSVGWRLYRLR